MLFRQYAEREVVVKTLRYMIDIDCQNTEGDFELVMKFACRYLNKPCAGDSSYDKDVYKIVSPLWNYYMEHLHDGYNVTIPRHMKGETDSAQ